MSRLHLLTLGLAACIGAGTSSLGANPSSIPPRSADFDKRPRLAAPTGSQLDAVARIRSRLPGVQVKFDVLAGAPRVIRSTTGFLTPAGSAAGNSAVAAANPDAALRGFLDDNRALFGHGAEALNSARTNRDLVAAHSGLRTKIWQQELDGIPVFEALLIAHTTRRGELVSVSSRFLPDPAAAAGGAARLAKPPISARHAVAVALGATGESVSDAELSGVGAVEAGPEARQRFSSASLRGAAVVSLTWVPVGKGTLRLGWDVIFTQRASGRMFRQIVDAFTGEVLLRWGLTADLADASYRVFPGNSPSPLLPTYPSPTTNQPAPASRGLVTFPALDTNASPAGWIADADNETRGNNVDAFADLNGDDLPDLPRPQGAPFRVFDPPLDLSQAPTNSSDAAVVELFYWCNWMHDTLYGLGFTEAAGNFQNANFGRGGLEGDALLAEAQDGSGFNNSDMSTPPDGSPPRLQMYLFNGPTPFRDGDFDTDIVLHEYTHGLSARSVGGGGGLHELQSRGLAEGWSDFYALALLSPTNADADAAYAFGAYASYLFGGLAENYYFGIRRFPYTTDMAKNPVTFKDIDPAQADPHAGVPLSPRFSPFSAAAADEVHNQGEIWCAALWEARSSLMHKCGAGAGNRLMLQLVTDGMNLTPANPDFLEARDAILQAELVDCAGTNHGELWAAFAKRGLGFSAVAPASVTADGVLEAFDRPDDFLLSPNTNWVAGGPTGGPFAPASLSLTLTNQGTNLLNWRAGFAGDKFSLSPIGGALAPAAATNLVLMLAAGVTNLPAGIYDDTAGITNLGTGNVIARNCRLRIGQPDYLTALLDSPSNALANQSFTFTPGDPLSFYAVCRETVTDLPSDPTGGNSVVLGDDDSVLVTLSGTNSVALFGERTNACFIGSNGYLTFDQADTNWTASLATHFGMRRVSALLDDLYPPGGGSISWKEFTNRVAVSFLGIRRVGAPGTPNTFQIELFFDGRIRLSYLNVNAPVAVVGLSAGQGIPRGFLSSDLGGYAACPLPLALTLPATATEGDGLLAGAGQVAIPVPWPGDLLVALASSDPARLGVPAAATIPAGQTNAVFDLTLLNDHQLDGTQTATVTAVAAKFLPANATMTIYDQQTADLFVLLPAAIFENAAPTQGVVQVSAPPARDVVVSLASSNPNKLVVPPTALIPAGQTSAVFVTTPVDNVQIDGPVDVTVTAHVQNWTDGKAVVTVLDSETLNLAVTLPAQATEGDGTLTNAGSVGISGTLPTNLVVNLASSDPSELTVPNSVLIPAGQLSNTFDLTVIEDWDVDSNQVAVVTASAAGFTNGAAAMLILDNDTPVAPTNPTPADLAFDVPADTVLEWAGGGVETTNDVYLGTSPVPGPADWIGTTTATNWAPPLLAPATTYYWQVVARRGTAVSGPVWRFSTRGVDHFDWDPIPSPQYVDIPFAVSLTARDAFGRAVTNFTGPVTLTGAAGPAPTLLFRANFEDGSLAGWVNGSGNYVRAITNQTAAAGQNSLTLIGGAGNPFDGVAHPLANLRPGRVSFSVRASVTNATGACVALGSDATLTNTAVLFYCRNDGTMGLDETIFGWHGVPYVDGRWYQITLDFDWSLKRVSYAVDGVSVAVGVPFRSNVDTFAVVSLYNATPTQAWWDEMALLSDPPPAVVPVTPNRGLMFTEGGCTTNLNVGLPVTNLYLVVTDATNHSGTVGPTTVGRSNQLSLTTVSSPSPVTCGSLLNYTIAVLNTGPETTGALWLTNLLPADVTFVSALLSQGTWIRYGRVVVCDLGGLAGATSATLNLTVIPTAGGPATNNAVLSLPPLIPAASNLFAQTITPVRPLRGTVNFASGSSLFLPSFGLGLPYPSTNRVSGIQGLVTNVTVTLSDFSHALPADVTLLLTSPSGLSTLLMAGAGGTNAVSHLTLQFDDAASGPLPLSGAIITGSYQATQYLPLITMPFPAPAQPYGTGLAQFDGTDPNGIWQLYALDQGIGGGGGVLGGWSLQLGVDAPSAPAPQLLDPSWNAGQFNCHFVTVSGVNYALEAKRDFADPVWQWVKTIVGDGTDKWITDWDASDSMRFYRIRVQ